jgi:hypothetical protein
MDATATFEVNDFRATLPGLTPQARRPNQALIGLLKRIAARQQATPA